MLAGGTRARPFGICGGISIKVAQTNFYPATASRADITRSIRGGIQCHLLRSGYRRYA